MLLSSQKPSISLGRMTGMRWWMGLSSSFAEVVMMAHVGIELPSGSFHMDHIPAKAKGSRRPHGDAHRPLAGRRRAATRKSRR